MKSVVDGEAAYIDQTTGINIYAALICKRYENVRLKKASQTFFTSEQGMAIRKGKDQHFKRKINKL